MISFQSTYKVPIRDGASVTVRRLSVIERVKRDLDIAEVQREYEELIHQYRALPEDGDATPEQQSERRRISVAISRLLNETIKPHIIRAGVVSFEGIELDGEPITVEQFLSVADDDILEAVFIACEAGAKLSSEELKNLPSLGTSNAEAAGSSENTIAESAASHDSTSPAIAESSTLNQ